MTTFEQIEQLPDPLRLAQQAIKTPELERIMKTLAKYGLGVCMPHMHTQEQDFAEQPANVVQVEKNMQVSFEDATAHKTTPRLAVAWRWQKDEDRIAVVQECSYDIYGHRAPSDN